MKTDSEKNGIHPLWVIAFGLSYFLASWIYYPFSNWGNRHFNNFFACNLVKWTGLECPTCGASRSAYYFATGEWTTSFFFHPSIFLASLFILLSIVWAMFRLLQGRRIQIRYTWNKYFAGFLALLCLFFWCFKLIKRFML